MPFHDRFPALKQLSAARQRQPAPAADHSRRWREHDDDAGDQVQHIVQVAFAEHLRLCCSMEEKLLGLVSARRGHFRLESGHHGNLWLDLDSLFLGPRRLLPFTRELAKRLSAYRVQAIVGPKAGGAVVAEMVAAELGIPSCFSERAEGADNGALYSVDYRVPDAFHDHLRGKAVAIVDEAINAGSATRATFGALQALQARPTVVGALLMLGKAASPFLQENDLPVEHIAYLANELWEPADCPLCAAGVPLSTPPAAG